MKKIFFVVITLFALLAACNKATSIHDGLYLVERVVTDKNTPIGEHEAYVPFDPTFLNEAAPGTTGVVLRTNDWVPFDRVDKKGFAAQTEKVGKIDLSFSTQSAEKLRIFTGSHILQQAAIVIDGHVMTVRRIRDTIREGRMEITSSGDDMREHEFERLNERK